MPAAPPFEAELSRRTLVRGGGALIVGLALGAKLTGQAVAAASPFASNGPADSMQSDSYLAMLADNTVHVKTGRVEIGQGSTTGLLLLVAEELDMNVDQLVFVRQDTNVTPEHRRDVRVELDRDQAGQRVRSRVRRGAAEPARAGVAATRRAGRESHASRAASSRAAAGRSPTASSSAGGCSGCRFRRRSSIPGRRPSKPVSAYRARRASRRCRGSTSRRR